MDQFMVISNSNFNSKMYYVLSFYSMAGFSRHKILFNSRYSFPLGAGENMGVGWKKRV